MESFVAKQNNLLEPAGVILIVCVICSHFEVLLRRFVFPACSDFDIAAMSTSPKELSIDQEEPIHILMIAVKADQTANGDEELSEKFLQFCQAKVRQG